MVFPLRNDSKLSTLCAFKSVVPPCFFWRVSLFCGNAQRAFYWFWLNIFFPFFSFPSSLSLGWFGGCGFIYRRGWFASLCVFVSVFL